MRFTPKGPSNIEERDGKLYELSAGFVFPITEAFLQACKKVAKPNGYIPFATMQDLIIRFYNNPLEPPKPFAREFRLRVVERLQLKKTK